MHDLIIIISLVNLGFFGGFTHCSGMCGPLVLTQVTNRLEKIPLNQFYGLKKESVNIYGIVI
jgi:sulfite exporter TauE/SafE